MKVFFKYFLLFLYTRLGDCYPPNATEDQFPLRSDYKYDEQAGGWVKWHPVPATWPEARLRCYYEGAVLASPVNKGLKRSMIIMLEEQQGISYVDKLFTGIHSTFSKGDYTSVDGVPLHEIDVEWSSYKHCEDCLALDRHGLLEGYECSTKLPYMCYKKASKDQRISMCGTVDQEYKYDSRTGSCYKFHRIGRTWSRAYMTCLAEGGHLAIINSDLEAQVISEIFKENPDSTIMAAYYHTASVGFRDWGERGSWWTIHGQDLKQAGYDHWDKGSPDSKDQFCGSINRSGKLNDIWCDGEHKTFPAICEINRLKDRQIY